MEWSLDPSLDWSGRPGLAPPSPLETECPSGHPSTDSVSAHDHEESYPAPSSAMDTERPGGQPLIDPVFSHGRGESCPASSPSLDTEYPGGQPQADPVLAHNHGEPYPASSPTTDTEFPSSQPPKNPIFSHGHGGSYPAPSPPMDMEYPSGQPPIDPVLTHGRGEPCPAPSPPVDTECPSSQPPIDSVFTHDHGEPHLAQSPPTNTEFPSSQPPENPVFSHGHGGSYPAPSLPTDMEHPNGQPPIDPVFTHGHGEPYPAPSPPVDTECPSSQSPMEPVFTHGHEEPRPVLSPPMDTKHPGGLPQTDPLFTHGHREPYSTLSPPRETEFPRDPPSINPLFTHGYGEPYPMLSPSMDTEFPRDSPSTNPLFTHGHGEPYSAWSPPMDTGHPDGHPPMDTEVPDQRMSTDRKILHELDVKHFRRVNSLIHHEMFDELLDLFKSDPRPVNLMEDPVLCLFISAKKTPLAVKLIERVERSMLRKENIFGDTPLHIAAVEGNITVAKALLLKDRSLMEAVNRKEETALHKAALYGHESMFWCLVKEGGTATAMYRKGDGSNMLHCAIMGNAPKLALDIATRFPHLILSRDAAAVTPLQLLVTIPNFFRSQLVVGRLESFFYKLIPEENSQSKNAIADEEVGGSINQVEKSVRSKCPSQYTTILDLMELIASWVRYGVFKILKQFSSTMRKQEEQKKRYAAAMQLVEYLANDKDYDFYCKGYSRSNSRRLDPTSYNATRRPSDLEHASGEDAQEGDDATETTKPAEKLRKVMTEVLDQLAPKTSIPNRWTEPPLIIAAERGLHDFVRKILKVCPQSASYLDSRGRNVLQVAVESGHNEVVSVLSEMLQGSNPILPSWLCSKLDNRSTKNTILHLAAENSPAEEGDAVQLHHELKWFEKVEKIVPKELINSRNKAEKTAKELFTEKHEKTLQNCKKQLVDMGMMCSSLLAAVVFASSFSIPGDSDKESEKLTFKIFSHAYVIGFGCAATALVLFLSFVIAPYKERYFRRAIPMQYLFACLSFALALVAFLVSFACKFVLQIYGGQRTHKTYLIPLLLELLLFPVTCIALLLYHGAKFGPSFVRFWK